MTSPASHPILSRIWASSEESGLFDFDVNRALRSLTSQSTCLFNRFAPLFGEVTIGRLTDQNPAAGILSVIEILWQLRPSLVLKSFVCNYCVVINRIGTGEVPDTVGVVSVAVLLQPATFSTVTSILPLGPISLTNTCRNPTIVTGGWSTVNGTGLAVPCLSS